MKISKQVIGLTLGAALMFGAGTMVANAKVNNMSYNRGTLGYTQLSSQNDNYNDNSNYNYNDEESFFREMHKYCHSNSYRSENSGYRNGMINY